MLLVLLLMVNTNTNSIDSLLQTQFQEIEKTRMTLEQQKQLEREAIDNKLKTAAHMRDENIKKMLGRLKEHVSNFHNYDLPPPFNPFALLYSSSNNFPQLNSFDGLIRFRFRFVSCFR